METERQPSTLQTILSMFRLSNTPTTPINEDDPIGDMDEPPDHVPELIHDLHKQRMYSKSTLTPSVARRESLLTKAIAAGVHPIDTRALPLQHHDMSRALSTASSHSVPSTAELTSDCELTSPARSVSPSPPPPASRLVMPVSSKQLQLPVDKVVIAPVTKDDKPAIVDVGEAAVEKKLGRKRCIMFACAEKPSEPASHDPPAVAAAVPEPQPEPQPRKSRLTFLCPTRQDSMNSTTSTSSKTQAEEKSQQQTSELPAVKSDKPAPTSQTVEDSQTSKPISKKPAPPSTFHEFATSQDETDSWVNQPSVINRPKLTLKDVMRKEHAIRQIGEEAEEEADEEAREQEELENEFDENDGEDDFAPSDDDDDDKSDGGNESDDENGFADSDDESDAGSEYQFWAPAATIAPTSIENLTRFSSRQRARSSSLESTPSQSSMSHAKPFHPRRASKTKAKAIKMRPAAPELPDSTDFVCGTLDEDRPLEAAYISCREQRKREKHIPIPQDIDPSFPTTDLEEDDDDEEEEMHAEESEPGWLRDQFGQMDDEERGRRRPSAFKISPPQMKPQPQVQSNKRAVNRSPPPTRLRSPPPRRLFTHSPSRTKSPLPAPIGRYRSPRGSPANLKMPLGITINRLAQRPDTDRTASLPHTPNPFFRNWKRGSPPTSRIRSGAVTPGAEEAVRPDMHVRGPVDIVIGLEKKRQKRKEKFWRQNCRKVAKEQSERKPIPGRGVERMKELGLECAERTRGYGLGQQAKHVLSL